MPREIAVYVSENGETASFYEKGQVVIYQKSRGSWEVRKQKSFYWDKSQGLKALRQKVEELTLFLEACKVFVALSVVGLPYYELEKANCSIWEFAGKPDEFLDVILEKEEEAEADSLMTKSSPELTVPTPVESSPGNYFISLKEVQANNSGVTSKQVLKPFLNKGDFSSLEIMCSHIPPWLEADMISGNIDAHVELSNREDIKIIVTNQQSSKRQVEFETPSDA